MNDMTSQKVREMPCTKEQAREDINKLIEKYERIKADGRIKRYNEEMTKKDFIVPLFGALGWDVYNKKADEVTAEEKVSRGRVDYAIRINGMPKLFVEAKALRGDLDQPKWAKQAINYAWHKGVIWAVLTDFEEVKVFNAEIKSTYPLQSLLFSLSYRQYLERFDQLWLLSRESLEQGLLDKEAEKWGKKLRKAPVDKQLLADFTRWRGLLSKDILKLNLGKDLTEEDLDESVQRILDRLIFIRSCEDRGLEQKALISDMREWGDRGRGALVKKVREIFRDFDDKYNSELFREHLCDELEISNEVLKDVISGLYRTQDMTIAYDFSAIDADVLGTIYEQYLGHLLKKTPKRAKLEAKKAHRKEHGIYYTPTYIVDYIVRNTLGELLKNKKVDAENIKILDPACGSGSFLIKSFDVLNEYWAKKDKDYAQTELDAETGAPFTRKVKILKNNIFGVDLDAKAVEIAQLNLLLKVAEKRHKLPLLRQNIKCGNSLIDDPDVAGDTAFKWEEEFSEIMKEGGFDVVVGNPPYINAIQLTKTVGESVKRYWKNKYYSAKGTYDIYILFFEQSLQICKEGGFVAFITPNKYLSSPYGTALRELIANNHKLIKILDLSKVKVFDDPSVYPVITIIQKTKPKREYTIITEKILSENVEDRTICKVSSKNLTSLPNSIWGILLSNNVDLIEKIFQKGEPLENVAKVQATSTAAEADEYSKHINENKEGLPIINTGTIDRYSTTYGVTKFMNKGVRLKKPCLDISQISESRKKLYTNPKIIISKLALRVEGFLDNEGAYASINTNCIHSPKSDFSIKYLAGIINSKLISFIYSELFSGLRMSGGYFQFQAPQLRVLPIVKISEEAQNKISTLVNKIVSLNKRLNELKDKRTDEKYKIEEKVKKTDAEIDELVYKLYGLSEKEIKIVEEAFA